jgi:hypothetical protein
MLQKSVNETSEISCLLPGLTSYLNSVLQGLLGVPDFVQDLTQLHGKLSGLSDDESSLHKPTLLRSFCKLAMAKESGLQVPVTQIQTQIRVCLADQS